MVVWPTSGASEMNYTTGNLMCNVLVPLDTFSLCKTLRFFFHVPFFNAWTKFSSSICLQVVQYLAGCGLQSCVMLVNKGYPDIGWNPVEGERYLDFLRFAVFCNGETASMSPRSRLADCCPHRVHSGPGESVEENANVVVRLLIRRPECFGPALRGEGGDGLLSAMEEAIRISQDLSRDGPSPSSERSKTL